MPRPAQRLRTYFRTLGEPEGRVSGHADVYKGKVAPGRGVRVVEIGTHVNEAQGEDPVIQEIVRRLNTDIVQPRFGGKSVAKLSGPSNQSHFPLPNIFSEVRAPDGRSAFEYLHDPSVQARLFPDLEHFEIPSMWDRSQTARRTLRGKVENLYYNIDSVGDMEVKFRHVPLGMINSDVAAPKVAQIELSASDPDPEVQSYLAKIQTMLVDGLLDQDGGSSPKRKDTSVRYAPIYDDALLAHLESQPSFKERYGESFRFARIGEPTVVDARQQPGKLIDWDHKNGNVSFFFRGPERDSGKIKQVGPTGAGSTSSPNKKLSLKVQISVQKDKTDGRWKVASVFLPQAHARLFEGSNMANRAISNSSGHPTLSVEVICSKTGEGGQPVGIGVFGVPEAYKVTLPLRYEVRRRPEVTGDPTSLGREDSAWWDAFPQEERDEIVGLNDDVVTV